MGGMSRRKGAVGEREIVDKLNSMGLLCRRSVQYAGKPGTDADVVCEGLGLHVEVKRTETFKWDDTLAQVQRDARGTPWVILHRKSRGPWLAIMLLDAWVEDSTAAQGAIAHRQELIARGAHGVDSQVQP